MPAGYCLADLQAFVNLMFSRSYGELPDGDDFFVVSETEPEAEDRDKIWVRLSAAEGYIEGFYKYYNGEWVRPHSVPANSETRQIWKGELADLTTYDGGDSDPAGEASGPMWEVDEDFEYRVPVGVGTLPISGTTIAVGDEVGVDQVTLAAANIPPLDVKPLDSNGAPTGDLTVQKTGAISGVTNYNGDFSGEGSGGVASDVNLKANHGVTPTPISNVQPSLGVYFIQRTSRIFIKAS